MRGFPVRGAAALDSVSRKARKNEARRCTWQSAEQIGERAGKNDSILKGVSGSRRSLRAVRQHPPLSIGRACQIYGKVVQINAARYRNAMAGTQERRIGKDEPGREMSFAEQSLATVKIGNDEIQKAGTLDQAFFQKFAIPPPESAAGSCPGPRGDSFRGDLRKRCR